MRFTVLNWNVGGAKLLEEKTKEERAKTRESFNRALVEILTNRDMGPQPDVVTLQETVRYREPSDPCEVDILNAVPGYRSFFFPLIDSDILSSKAKWNKVKRDSDWSPKAYFAQGNTFLIKERAPHFPVWDLSNAVIAPQPEITNHYIELVHLDSGLYFGNRDTEPRAALVAHFVCDPDAGRQEERTPLDIFVVNVHLTTLLMEREGVPEIDALAAKIRQSQLDVIFHGIVSRYNKWRRSGYRERGEAKVLEPHETTKRYSPVWIIAGDFNFTEDSAEYAWVKRMNFIDTIPIGGKNSPYGTGTKASGVGSNPTLVLDYIFAGPKFVSLDPAIQLHANRVIHDHSIRTSDHYPLLSSMELIPFK